MAKHKTIITCAVTGAVHTPTMSDALPVSAEAIAKQAIDAANAGAAILHLHARKQSDGSPSIDPKDFAKLLPEIKSATNAVVNISTGGSLTATIDDRIAPAMTFSPEMCSMNMGSINFSFHLAARKLKEYKYDWEEGYIKGSKGNIFRNTFSDIEYAASQLSEHGIKFEHECYDIGHLYNLKFCLDQGMFKAPLFIQFVLGILGGIGPDIENLVFMKQTADRLFGKDYQWSILGVGRDQMSLATIAAQMGGNVRVGLEDSLSIGLGKLAESNAEQVKKIKYTLEDQGHEIASPDDAREYLALKGADKVSF